MLSNIHLTLEQGKIYGVLGPNGAGKTTLFKSMLGLTAFSGKILSDGQPVSSRCFGSLIEYPAFYPRLTVEENLKLLECVNEKNFKLAFDTQNPSGFKGANGPAILKELVQYINIVHIKDGIGNALGAAHLGEGDSHFQESIDILKAAGFNGPIISENGYKKSAFYKVMGDPFKAIKEDVRRYVLAIR